MGTFLAGTWSLSERVMKPARFCGFVTAKIALAGIVLSYSFEVISRYIFGSPTWWSAELVTYLLCIMTFTMLPHVTATSGHIAVTFLLEYLKPARRTVIMRVISFIGAAICAAIAYFAADETMRQFARNVQMMAAQPIPKWWVSIWISVGFGLAALEFLLLTIKPHPGDSVSPQTPHQVA